MKEKQLVASAGTLVVACHVTDNSGACSSRSETWKTPKNGWVKINVDAAYSCQDGKSHMGCIARDHHGKVLWASSRETGRSMNAEEAEAKACLVALQ